MSTHACPGGCGAQVARVLFACRACWARLPRDLQQRIQAAYLVDNHAHIEAMADAITWYARGYV